MIVVWDALMGIKRIIVFQLAERIIVFAKSSEAVKRKYCGSMLRFPYCAISARHKNQLLPYLR